MIEQPKGTPPPLPDPKFPDVIGEEPGDINPAPPPDIPPQPAPDQPPPQRDAPGPR